MKQIFKHTLKSYFLISLIGCIIGLVTRLTDFFPNDTIWGFSSIATLFGFWIISATIIVYFSSSNINAGLNVFLYLFLMSLTFYASQLILGEMFHLFENEFKTELLVLYAGASVCAGICGYILYFWNKGTAFSNILYALPVGILSSEAIGLFIYFVKNSMWLFQLLMDIIGVIVLGVLFYKKVSNKLIYSVSVITISMLGYFGFYALFI